MAERRDDRVVVGLAVAVLGSIALAAVLVPLRGHVSVADVALALVLPVVAGAAVGGASAGAGGAVAAALSLNFFHTRPYYSLHIDSRDDVATVVLLLVVGIAVGTIASGRLDALVTARSRKDVLARIHRVAELAARGADPTDLAHAVEAELIGALHLRACHFEQVPAGGSDLPRIQRGGSITTPSKRFTVGTYGAFTLPPEGVEIAVYGRGAELGRLVCDPTPGIGVPLEHRIAAIALADQLGSVLAATR